MTPGAPILNGFVATTNELGYAAITSSFAKPTSGAGAEDVTGLTVTITPGTRPIYLHFWSSHLVHNTNAATATVLITDATPTTIATRGALPIANPASAVGGAVPYEVWARVTPPAGVAITYKVRLNTSAGIPTIVAAATAPAFLRAVEA